MTEASTPSIGEAVATLRTLRGHSQATFANMIGVSLSLLRKVEQGSRPATAGFTAAAARALNCPMAELTGQPYRGEDAESDRIHSLLQPIRRELVAYCVAPEVDGPLPSLEFLRNQVAWSAQLVHSLKMGKLAELLPGLMYDLRALIHSSIGDTQAEAYGLLSRAYADAMVLTYKLGYADLSSITVDRYEWAAARSNDPLAALVGEWYRGGELMATGDYGPASTMLEDGLGRAQQVVTENESPQALSVQGMFELKAALIRARAGDPATTRDYLDAAADTGARLGKDRDDYRLQFGPTNVRVWKVAVLGEIGEHDAALRTWKEELSEGKGFPTSYARERVTSTLLDVARSNMWLGTPAHREKSLTALLAAEKLSPTVTRVSPSTRETVRALGYSARRSADGLIGLAHRMNLPL